MTEIPATRRNSHPSSDSARRVSTVNDAVLPKPGAIRKRVNRVVDQVAFSLIKHCLSRARHQAFDPITVEQYARRWANATVEDYYALPDFPESKANAEALHRHTTATPSRFELTLDSPLRGPHRENNRYRLEFHLARPIDQAPVFIILHGWRSVSVNGYSRMCRELNALGVNAAVTHLPYHFSRRPYGSYNGEMAISADLVRSGDGLRHGVMEMRWLTRHFKAMGASAVGLWGTSYGGWISALTAIVEPRLDAVLMLEPPTDIERIFWEIPLFEKLTAHLRRNGIHREPIRHLFDLVSPGNHTPVIDQAKIVILGSLYDSIATPESLQKFHKCWPDTHLEIFPFAHISYKLHLAAMTLFKERLLPQLECVKREA